MARIVRDVRHEIPEREQACRSRQPSSACETQSNPSREAVREFVASGLFKRIEGVTFSVVEQAFGVAPGHVTCQQAVERR